MRRTSIGNTDHLVTLDVAGAPVGDGDGGYTEGAVPLDPPIWYCAMVSATAGREAPRAGTISATATHRLRGRFHPEITVRTRITYDDPHRGPRVFAVESVENVEERGVELELIVHEVVGEGVAP